MIDRPSFPTRRSSDLAEMGRPLPLPRLPQADRRLAGEAGPGRQRAAGLSIVARRRSPVLRHLRSEEHTSELQSRFDLVCRLLLEKKNTYEPQSTEVQH